MNGRATIPVLRIARRNVSRNRWRNVLVALLVLLPVAAMSGAVTYFATTTPSPEARATDEMGRADVIVYPSLEDAGTAELIAALPPGSGVESFTWIDDRLVLAGRQLRVTATSMDPNGLSAGRQTLLEGRYPAAPDEVAMTRPVIDLASAELGQQVELARAGRHTVVGVIEVPLALNARRVLLHPSHADDSRWAQERSWLVDLPDWVEMPIEPALPYEIEVSLHPQFSASPRSSWSWSGDSGPAKIGTLVFGALALIMTVLVASAAFAVSTRRRQRELGLLAAVGASRRHLAGTVAGEGLLLGLVGAAVGIVVGMGAVAVSAPWLDDLTNRRNPPVQLDVLTMVVAGGLGLLAAMIAAAIPAWSAARLPVVVALSGRRPPQASARRVLVLGLVLIVAGTAMTAAGATSLLADPASDTAFMLLAAGAIVGILGFGATSPWLIERLEWIGQRLPLTPRIALRDAARARSRSAPIVTAMLAGLAATIAMAAFLSSYSAWMDTQWRPWARADQLFIEGSEAGFAGPEIARELDAVASGALTPITTEGQITYTANGTLPQLGPDEYECSACASTDAELVVGDAELLTALGAESAGEALADGRAVILTSGPVRVGEALFVGQAEDGDLRQVPIPMTTADAGVDGPSALPGAVIPTSLAAELDLTAAPFASTYVIRLNRDVTESDVERADGLVASLDETYARAPLDPPRSDDTPRWAITIASFLFALSVAAIAVALGEAESRPDQRTLLAVGADPRIRRRIVASRAGVLGLLAGHLALPAGLIPAWGLLASRGVPMVLPVAELALVVIALPLAAILGALLLSRPVPGWSALRDVSG